MYTKFDSGVWEATSRWQFLVKRLQDFEEGRGKKGEDGEECGEGHVGFVNSKFSGAGNFRTALDSPS
jgi:hypothetical protein